jgi:addiction module HigA family antidote
MLIWTTTTIAKEEMTMRKKIDLMKALKASLIAEGKRNAQMGMKNPPHPGRIVRQECLEPFGLTVKEAARRLGVTRQALNNVVNEKAAISAEMAMRLSKAFGSSPEVWLGLQNEYDLAQLKKQPSQFKVRRIA